MTVRIEKAGAVWTVIHSRPEARNAMDPASAEALVEAFTAFDRDPEAVVAVLWGEGGAFCAGFDLKHAAGNASALDELGYPIEVAGNLPRGPHHAPRGPMGPTRLELDKPVIAAVAGPAVAGGFEVALWCDLRVMETTAYFGVYCRRWGVPLVDGGTVRLPRIIGRGRALDLILTGRKVEAEEALHIGLAERVVPEGQSRPASEALAREIARFPQACLRADRRSAYQQEGQSLREAMRYEWDNGVPAYYAEGAAGAARFASGKGRSGRFDDL
ncbi:MAG: crotonase/enoyl-CoA hydratase family protein [Proteobacteria bacterium]|nr:crotonase/enoyl-CoA hydratase family protein [Pseudomonadota bacterium]MDA0981790.1 crotonase/enoyl-CoA hydratase family protein [Pseudomonadota bacterium]